MSVSKIQKQTSISESEKYDFAQTHQDYQMNGQPSSIDDPEENDLADEIERWRERCFAFFPLRRVHFTRMRRDILHGLPYAAIPSRCGQRLPR